MQPITGIGKRQELGRSRFATPEHNILPFIIPCSGSGTLHVAVVLRRLVRGVCSAVHSLRCDSFCCFCVLSAGLGRPGLLPRAGARMRRALCFHHDAGCRRLRQLGGVPRSARPVARQRAACGAASGSRVWGQGRPREKISPVFKTKTKQTKTGYVYVLCVCMLAV